MKEGFAIWLTGPPASGKSTIARALLERLKEKGIGAQILESDELRKVLTPRPKYTEEERDNFYASLVYIGSLLTKNGVNVIFDATGYKREYRERARRAIKRFFEIYVKCPIETCKERDVKGLYRMAEEGKITTLPGVQVPYEEPLNPAVILSADKETVEESINKIMKKLSETILLK